MFLDHAFPPDPRVANEARSLVAAGHEVHLLCLRDKQEIPARELWQGVHLHRIRMPEWFRRKASAVSLELPVYRLALRSPLRGFIEQNKIEILHVHDLPMVELGLRAAHKAKIPVLADLHENWPAALRTYGYTQRFLGRLLISPDRWERHERTILPQVDRIVVVIEEARERLVAMGIDQEKIDVVRNTVSVDEFRGFGIDPDILTRFRGRFVLSYLGGFEKHRGLEPLVDAMPRIVRERPDCLLLLVGTGSNERGLRERVRRLGLAEHVVFEGWQPFARFPSYITASSVCLIPHLRNDHTDTTIPHKLFHYMLLRRAVCTTDCRPLKRIVEETGCGLVVPAGDGAALARAISDLSDRGRRESMGAAGEEAVRTRYNWEVDAARLSKTYERLAASSSPRSRS